MIVLPGDIEPVVPEERAAVRLRELAHAVQREAWQFAGLAHESVRAALRPLLRQMNSYYTNRIEGQHTLPIELERAMRREFSTDAAQAAKQRIAVAHVEAEATAEIAYANCTPPALFAPTVLTDLHRRIYGGLPAIDRRVGAETVEPGELRHRDVAVGDHVAPPAAAVPALLGHVHARYAALPAGESLLIGIACVHHRLAWIHPFLDGNGRAVRLHSHLLLQSMGLTQGLWSPMRGLARNRDRYYTSLREADRPRRNDLDGRGTLSQEALVAFAEFFLEVCLDQVTFMRTMLRLDAVPGRLQALLAFERSQGHDRFIPSAADALTYAFFHGPMERGRFAAMLGVPERSGRRTLTALLEYGLLTSPTPKGPVSFAVPLRALRFVFPALWPEAEADAS